MPVDVIRIKILVDNKTSVGLVEEHGFSVWIEVAGRKVLFDTGQGKALVANAAVLGCDLRELDALILSHGHYDHCGAMSQLLEVNPGIHVYAHAGALTLRNSIKPGEPARDVAVPQTEREALSDLPANQKHWIDRPQEILSLIGITGTIERQHPLEDTGGSFFLDTTSQIPDPIMDDMSIWIETGKGLVIITGCCHSGLINTVSHIRRVSGVEKVHAIIGGLHLHSASRERLKTTCSALFEWNPEFVVPCHCTGENAVSELQYELGSMIIPGYAGFEMEF